MVFSQIYRREAATLIRQNVLETLDWIQLSETAW